MVQRQDDISISEKTSLLQPLEQQQQESDKESNHGDGVYDANDDDNNNNSVSTSKHLQSTIALCLVVLTHSYLLISVFPYSGFMAIELIPNGAVNEENAGSYAGFIASTFMIGRALSSYPWGIAADTYGRIFVLNASLILSLIFSLLFGLAPTFGWALTFRCLLGLGNGMIGTAKTSVSELANGNSKLETRGMGIVMGMWGWGFLFAPALGGALAEPIRQYPNNNFVLRFEGILSKFPFLLPNLAGCLFCIISLIAINLWIHETLPVEKQRSPLLIPADIISWIKGILDHLFCCCCFATTNNNNNNIDTNEQQEKQSILLPCEFDNNKSNSSRNSYKSTQEEEEKKEEDHEIMQELRLKHNESCTLLGMIDNSEEHEIVTVSDSESITIDKVVVEGSNNEEEVVSLCYLWMRNNVRTHLLIYWLMSFCSICVDEAFPLFCISKAAGLGLTEATIGKILSGSGLIFACCQYFTYATIVHYFGLYKSIYVGSSVFGVIMLIPVSLLLNKDVANDDNNGGELTWSSYLFLSVIMAIFRIFMSAFFSSITIATNRTVQASGRATMNGLSMLGGSVAKSVGPSFAGTLVAISFSSGLFSSPQTGSVFVFVTIGMMGLVLAISSMLFLEGSNKKT